MSSFLDGTPRTLEVESMVLTTDETWRFAAYQGKDTEADPDKNKVYSLCFDSFHGETPNEQS